MQNDIIICRIVLMTVMIEMRCHSVNLNIACPQGASDLYPGIEKIRAGITVITSRIQHCDPIPVRISQSVSVIEAIFPKVMQEFLFHLNTIMKQQP
jgi:hypothetical protein